MSQRFKITIDVAYEGDISDPSRLLGSVQDNIKGLLDPYVVVDEFSVDLEETVELQKLKIENGKVKCPHCENTDIKQFQVLEYSTTRGVHGIDGSRVVVSGYATLVGGNLGEEHLECRTCEGALDLPDGFEFDYRG